MWPGVSNAVMHRKRVRKIWGIWEKSVSWVPGSVQQSRVLASEEDGWLSELADAFRRVPHVVWGRWKSQHRKIVYLPPRVEKPFNSKVIKSFVPELRCRKCFSCFGIPMLYIYMCVMNILCTFHISMFGFVTPFAQFQSASTYQFSY